MRIVLRIVLRIVRIVCIILLFFFVFVYIISLDTHIPGGYISSEKHYDEYGFQDSTNFCIYRYRSADPFMNKEEYRLVSNDAQFRLLMGYFFNFRKQLGLGPDHDRINEYTFDESSITMGDYFYIDKIQVQEISSSPNWIYENYTIYYFDTETLTLYYIHSNM